MSSQAFLDSILDSVRKLGWASSFDIAEDADWDVSVVVDAINELKAQDKLAWRTEKGKILYGIPVSKAEIVQKKPEEKKITFNNVQQFMAEACTKLPQEELYTTNEIATAMINVMPPCEDITSYDIAMNLALMCRLGKIEAVRSLFNEKVIFRYRAVN
jgi:hypothetical protein